MIRVLVVAAAVAAAVLACNGKKARPTPPSGGGEDANAQAAQRCDALRDKVAGLYQVELSEPVDGEIDDNAHMILKDCRTDPDRFVPCIETATNVAQLERDCVVPLDDEGTVEAAQFK